MVSDSFCGYIAIVGRPNVGKSTLLNQLLGKKVSITSYKPQTTRHRIFGVKTVDNVQFVYVDTPGFHITGKKNLNRFMNKGVVNAIKDVDIILFVVDSDKWFEEDKKVLELIQQQQPERPVILVINKIDSLNEKNQALLVADKLKEYYHFSEIVPTSALNAENTAKLEEAIRSYLPKDMHGFPDDAITDRSENFLLAEIVREKIFRMFQQEIPYDTTVSINFRKKQGKTIHVDANIYVEREGQKKIIVPKLKDIGIKARKDMEALLGAKIFLHQWVKVKTGWSDNPDIMRNLGFDDE